jgi:hypothetical protein
MNKLSRSLLGLSLVVAFSSSVGAQGNAPPHNVLQITREFTKPGKTGMAHDKTESLFVQAMSKAKWPTRYLGMTSLSGKQRALFFIWYESFDAWDKDMAAQAKNAALAAALERANVTDGELLDSVDQGVFVSNEEMSLRPMVDISHQRYLEISSYHVRPGHTKDWNEAVKMVRDAYEKGVPGAHWRMVEQRYGGDGGVYLVLTSHKTLAEIDRGFAESKQFQAAMGEDGMKKLNELVEKAVESSQHQLFAFNPRMSYVADEWVKADPDYWKPKAAAAPAAKPAAEDKKVKP